MTTLIVLPRVCIAACLLAMLAVAPPPAAAQTPTQLRDFAEQLQPIVAVFQGTQRLIGRTFESDNLLPQGGPDAPGFAAAKAALERSRADIRAERARLDAALGQITLERAGLHPIHAKGLEQMRAHIRTSLDMIPEALSDQEALVDAMERQDTGPILALTRKNMQRRITFTEGQRLFSEVRATAAPRGSFGRALVENEVALLDADLAILNQELAMLDGASGKDGGYRADYQSALERGIAALDESERKMRLAVGILAAAAEPGLKADLTEAAEQAITLRRAMIDRYREYRDLVWTEDGTYREDVPLERFVALDRRSADLTDRISLNAVRLSDLLARSVAGEQRN